MWTTANFACGVARGASGPSALRIASTEKWLQGMASSISSQMLRTPRNREAEAQRMSKNSAMIQRVFDEMTPEMVQVTQKTDRAMRESYESRSGGNSLMDKFRAFPAAVGAGFKTYRNIEEEKAALQKEIEEHVEKEYREVEFEIDWQDSKAFVRELGFTDEQIQEHTEEGLLGLSGPQIEKMVGYQEVTHAFPEHKREEWLLNLRNKGIKLKASAPQEVDLRNPTTVAQAEPGLFGAPLRQAILKESLKLGGLPRNGSGMLWAFAREGVVEVSSGGGSHCRVPNGHEFVVHSVARVRVSPENLKRREELLQKVEALENKSSTQEGLNVFKEILLGGKLPQGDVPNTVKA